MTVRIDMGVTTSGATANLDLEELLATRLLVQGNSGSGKSHLLRRLIEQSAPWVQQAIIDPEGDFVSLADAFGHVVIDASSLTENALQMVGGRVRQHRVSVILNLENLDAEAQMRHAAAFLGGLFDIERDYWFPMLVVVDEAQMFAPSAAGDVSDEARKASLGAMTNLMCRGRKRGLAGIIATQRLAKLAKNVAAEASNFLMGRTFLDIDMARAADLLGMERRQAEAFRDLQRGHFIALGPALARRPLSIRVGGVTTQPRAVSPHLLPLPETPREDARDLLFQPGQGEAPRYSARRPVGMSTSEILQQLAHSRPPARPPVPPTPPAEITEEGGERIAGDVDDDSASPTASSEGESHRAKVASKPSASEPAAAGREGYDGVLADLLGDQDAVFRSVSVLYQDFLVRCRKHGLNGRMLDLVAFRRKLAGARAGAATAGYDEATAHDETDGEWQKALDVAAGLAEDVHGVFLLLARTALEGRDCPSDLLIARALGSRSPRRARSMVGYMEQRGLIVCREEMDGSRVIVLPGLDWQTAPGDPSALDDVAEE
ncbi:ATP-binding protein [Telmatospirillum siberiense]|uniref:ATP-binding protein n=1 Tax=Telmatospirillum siberiense TaxID=382514 RepID=A0A2N3PZ69_9PROT|nr:ATP-binding protein [Telmatospirillum siberiense]PKU25688.1 ATP-binding protein [Telmatospirillum siberiense]